MTMPHSPGWYDDPDDPAAERYFNGQDWTPQRKRKPSTPSRPPQPDPYAPVPPAGPVDPYASAYPYGPVPPVPPAGPYGPIDPYGAPGPYGPADPYGPPARPAGAYGPAGGYGLAGAYGPADPYGAVPPVGVAGPYGSVPPQQPPLSRLTAGIAGGVDRIFGLVISGCGVALIVASFATWGRVRAAVTTADGAVGSASVSFPGLGDPSLTLSLSEGGTSVNGKIDTPLLHALHNTNPGWISLALGIVAIIAGAAYLWLRQRLIVAVAVAVLGGISWVICISYILDVRSTFSDPPGLADINFSPGAGLVAACVLSFALAAAGITAAVIQWRAQYKNSPY
jgi:hypothetical protein